jgi:DNA polymerase III epsilon subunit-like protein
MRTTVVMFDIETTGLDPYENQVSLETCSSPGSILPDLEPRYLRITIKFLSKN